jgi:hypothetical protein
MTKKPAVPQAGTHTLGPQQPVPVAWQKAPGPSAATHWAELVQVDVAPQEKSSPQAVNPSTLCRQTQVPPAAGVPHCVRGEPQVNVVPHEAHIPPTTVCPIGHSHAQVLGLKVSPVTVQVELTQLPPQNVVPAGQTQAPPWQVWGAVQMIGVPTQTPPRHMSLVVQGLPSSQGAPVTLMGLEQSPVAGSQVPATWHGSSGVHRTGLPPTQVPLWQVSVCVQGLLSLQAVLSGLAGLEQSPVAGLQAPATWH